MLWDHPYPLVSLVGLVSCLLAYFSAKYDREAQLVIGRGLMIMNLLAGSYTGGMNVGCFDCPEMPERMRLLKIVLFSLAWAFVSLLNLDYFTNRRRPKSALQ